MKAGAKRYKFINSETGYIIFYHTIKDEPTAEECKTELEKVQAQVAIKNGIFIGSVYWEEIKDQQ